MARFLNSKRNENLADSTLDKLTTIFEKQFLAWATSYGFTHITEITTADLEGFRDTWNDGPLAKKKKQERLIGFFYYCLRLGWIKSNPAVLLGRIRADRPPTDYFPKCGFDEMMDANAHLSTQRVGGIQKSGNTASTSEKNIAGSRFALAIPLAIRS